jgi:hypothetical protein
MDYASRIRATPWLLPVERSRGFAFAGIPRKRVTNDHPSCSHAFETFSGQRLAIGSPTVCGA